MQEKDFFNSQMTTEMFNTKGGGGNDGIGGNDGDTGGGNDGGDK